MAREVKDIAASVFARLKAQAQKQGEDVQSVLTRYCVERFLYRLSISAHKERFLLKGAALFSLWFDQPHRPTKDVDLLGYGANDIPTLETVIREICKTTFDDGLLFDTNSVHGGLIREEEAYQGVRLKFVAMIGKVKIPLQVDIGFGDAVTPGAEIAEFPTLLDFPSPQLKVYPKETVVAEKFEAMVRFGMANGRMKDFWDVNFMIEEFDFDGRILQEAIRATFRTRQTSFPTDLPVALRDEFAKDGFVAGRWSGFISRNRIERSTELDKIIERLRSFLAPVIEAESKGDSFIKKWQGGRNWI